MLKRLFLIFLVLCLLPAAAPLAAAEPAPNPSKVSLPKAQSVMKNRQITLTPKLTPAEAATTYTWSTSKKSVATVADGVVTGVNPGKAVITVRTANKKKASCTVTVKHVSMDSFSVALSDWQGGDCYYEDEDEDMAFFWEVTGHKMYPSIGDVSPADANRAITWKSGNSKIASVSSKGVITCKKQGAAVITATSKYGGHKVRFPVVVINNRTNWAIDEAFEDLDEYEEDYYYTSAKSVYAKGGYLYVDMYILNMHSFTIRRMSKQSIYLTLNAYDTDFDDYAYAGSYKPTLKNKIRPYSIGVATFKLRKVSAAKEWLIDADAYCEGYAYAKDIGAEPKASIPGVSGAARPAGKAKPVRSIKARALPLRRGA